MNYNQNLRKKDALKIPSQQIFIQPLDFVKYFLQLLILFLISNSNITWNIIVMIMFIIIIAMIVSFYYYCNFYYYY